MRHTILLAAALLAAGPSVAIGQSGTATDPSRAPPIDAPGGTGNDGITPGANSYTQSQAQDRLQAAGLTAVTGLRKGDDGVWQGEAQRNGQPVTVLLDYQGDMAVKRPDAAEPELLPRGDDEARRRQTSGSPPAPAR